jgi:hypothetical protein
MRSMSILYALTDFKISAKGENSDRSLNRHHSKKSMDVRENDRGIFGTPCGIRRDIDYPSDLGAVERNLNMKMAVWRKSRRGSPHRAEVQPVTRIGDEVMSALESWATHQLVEVSPVCKTESPFPKPNLSGCRLLVYVTVVS